MNLLKKVSGTPNICTIYLDFTGESVNYDASSSSFHNTILANGATFETHFQKGNVSFQEESSEVAAGILFKQKLSITFNSSDSKRSERILEYHKTKHVIIKLTNGEVFVLGRNDFKQNKKPIITTNSNDKISSVEFYSESIIPISKFLGSLIIGLPEIIPLYFGIEPLEL